MFKKTLPLNPDGSVDFSKVDPHNDFHLFPKIYQCPEDIEKFILEENLKDELPLIVDILKCRKTKKLGITTTEDKWYFDELFDYIYDVFRIPLPETKKQVKDWLDVYVTEHLRIYGFSYFKEQSFKNVRQSYKQKKDFQERMKAWPELLKGNVLSLQEINYTNDIGVGEGNCNSYYLSSNPDIIEQFWIKSDLIAGQPRCIEETNEAYMRVWVYPDRVYIFGCDDMSWTLTTKNAEESKDFACFLKCAAPVWNFCYPELIHPNLEFTN